MTYKRHKQRPLIISVPTYQLYHFHSSVAQNTLKSNQTHVQRIQWFIRNKQNTLFVQRDIWKQRTCGNYINGNQMRSRIMNAKNALSESEAPINHINHLFILFWIIFIR